MSLTPYPSRVRSNGVLECIAPVRERFIRLTKLKFKGIAHQALPRKAALLPLHFRNVCGAVIFSDVVDVWSLTQSRPVVRNKLASMAKQKMPKLTAAVDTKSLGFIQELGCVRHHVPVTLRQSGAQD
jgi:hypothetical protein